MLRKEQSNRLKKVSVRIAVVILTGLLYFVITSILGYGIPCPIRLITGLQCPGCGVSRMLSSIIKLNFTDAFDYHPVLFTSLPFLAIIFNVKIIIKLKHSKQNHSTYLLLFKKIYLQNIKFILLIIIIL